MTRRIEDYENAEMHVAQEDGVKTPTLIPSSMSSEVEEPPSASDGDNNSLFGHTPTSNASDEPLRRMARP